MEETIVKKNLTERELQCLFYSACGMRESDIAEELSISPHTVRVHLANAKKRLGATNKTHSVILALLSGELDLEIIRKDEHFVGSV